MSTLRSQMDTDASNSSYWEEMCGTSAAKALGITGRDCESLQRFDTWYFEFYPYLDDFIDFADVRDKDVLEVGLGYGSVSQRLAESGARFTGLDIAAGPVAGVNHRLAQSGLPGKAIQGSVLKAPFENESFDVVVAIGCFHHTGDLERALDETRRVLRPGGRATIMVYNAASYIRWIRFPGRTLQYVYEVAKGERPPLSLDADAERGQFDLNADGNAAPETVLVSKTHFVRILSRRFRDVSVRRMNAALPWPLHVVPRDVTIALVGPMLGLDLYAQVRK